MSRRADWHDKMWAAIDAHMDAQFDYGKTDCCLFTARVVDAFCDTEHEKTLSEHYKDEATALAYIEVSGGLEAAVSTYLGQSKVGRAQRGDVVMFNGARGQTLGICVGQTIASVYSDGVVFLPRSLSICYWTV